MRICFPVKTNEGINSVVYSHFGSAPAFVIIDTETENVTVIENKDQKHAHGACNPLSALNGQRIDAVIVGGIGAGALNKLNQTGIKVFQAKAVSIKENIKMFYEKGLSEFVIQNTCSFHRQKGGCSH